MAQTLRPRERLRRRADFQRVYDQGTRLHGRFMTLVVLPNALEVTRLGIVATRKLGGAVRRNRAKRLVREVFRRCRIATGLDVIVAPRRELLDRDPTDVESDYSSTLRRYRRP